ncbi:nicotinamidase-related amidase [Breznakia sp. PF5-3]|uniref:isochorismatase family protein n=1 Tax=unclassified Breznakia TaxID=2623764 RepID=UPI002406EFEC|nr:MULTISPECIES: isochorismatase family protein [unclassified Breznakia]MDF9825003.1 nicotinamidase-related amidase [Breznakia sp. PM6-1]MDF9835426.1 nicotinamidase-related amidase [Breznakia sp. PF5-3]MDF9837658.1 nicotinamidase-related amidase [Breznakia sp. PFB2-8]MDF9859522.1 nicotinamidase-related amidase [Breznakia sp. PH5-24]
MAKVSKQYKEKIPTATFSDLSRPIVFVVDMINGFTKEGALSDASILEINDDIIRLLKNEPANVFVCDSHNLDAREFESYPIHCIENTEESDVIHELKEYVQDTIYKNSTNAFVAEGFQSQMEEYLLAYDDYVIVGCCSDICIMQFALAFQTFLNEHNLNKKRIIVPINMIETFHIEGVHDQQKMNETACGFMISNGIQVVEMR